MTKIEKREKEMIKNRNKCRIDRTNTEVSIGNVLITIDTNANKNR